MSRSVDGHVYSLAEMNDMKDRFLATMSHELRTPLNGIIGTIELLEYAGHLNEKQNKYITILKECSNQLLTLLNNVLELSKLNSKRLKLAEDPFDLQDAVDVAIRIASGKAAVKNIKFNSRTTGFVPPMLIGDRQRFIQVMNNILDNAIKFTPPKGDVNFTINVERMPDRGLVHVWRVTGSVTDTGLGISPEAMKTIFEAFHQSADLTLAASSKGTGLGLSICRELVKMMGGDIHAYSGGLNMGSTFNFTATFEEELDIRQLLRDYSMVLSNKQVLVVDDCVEFRVQLVNILSGWGILPICVASAEEALQQLKLNPNFDLAIIDVYMPYMSGIQLAQTLETEYPYIPRIAISSVDDVTSGQALFDYFLYKPIKAGKLIAPIINCLSGDSGNKKLEVEDDVKSLSPRRRQNTRDNLKILIAEDDENNRFVLHEMLSSLGYLDRNIYFAEDGKTAVDMAKEMRFDVVLMDIVMPVMNGFEATKHMRQLPDPPYIVVVSAAVQDSDMESGQRVGVDAYLGKPIARDKLEGALSTLLCTSELDYSSHYSSSDSDSETS